MQFTKPEVRSRLKAHEEEWEDCYDCPLSEMRYCSVLWRGYCPAKIVFVGEGPGFYENLHGFPFIGPAGQKLQEILDSSQEIFIKRGGSFFTYLLTNVVACIPCGDNGTKDREPTTKEMKACSSRLEEIIEISQAKVVIAVGAIAEKGLKKLVPITDKIIHPSAILQMDPALQTPAYLRCVSQIVNALEENYPCSGS